MVTLSSNHAKTCKVSIVIKALNEERNIAAAIQTALDAVAAVGGEVILADSFSSDRTIEIALAFPIRVVQLKNPLERCCGIGPQLGYQYVNGEFVYILDGDMQMLPGFLPEALAFMDANPKLAGVGGLVVEMNTHSLEYLARMERATGHMQAGPVDRLDMGGLYRRAAVEQAGYFSNRNLHSYEEFDLAMRLQAKGWQLARIAVNAVKHHGHDAPPYALLLRRWKSGYINGLGEVLRAAWGQAHWAQLVRSVRELRLYVAVLVWCLTLGLVWLLELPMLVRAASFTALLVTPVLLMGMRKRSLEKGLFAVVSWVFNAMGTLRGLLKPQRPVNEAIDSNTLRDLP